MTAFEKAFAAHGAGHLSEAETGYRAVLATEPKHADAWHLLGMLQHQRGQSREGADSINQALRIAGPQASYLTNLGVVLLTLGRINDAAAALQQALALQPPNYTVVFALASALHAAGRFAEAEARYREALALQPASAAAYNNLGNVLKDAGRAEDAAEAYRRALAIDPKHARARISLGIVRQDEGILAEVTAEARAAREAAPNDAQAKAHLAMTTYELGMLYTRAQRWDLASAHLLEAVALRPDDPLLRNNLANALVSAKRPAEAEAHLRHALAAAPDLAEAHFNLGNALRAQDKLDEAIAAYETALGLKKPFTKSRLNLGGVLVKLDRGDDAIGMFEAGAKEDPASAELLNALGVALQAAGRDDEAFTAFRRALAINPDSPDALRNVGVALLMHGDFAAGWEAYSHRWRCDNVKDVARDFGLPRWHGESEGTVLVWGEQGIGDNILYAGMIPDLLARGQQVVMETNPRLTTLFERSFPGVKAVGHETPSHAVTGRSDIRWQTPLPDLGRWLRADAKSFPTRNSYLVADPARVQAYRARLEEGAPTAIVGISWKSVNPKLGRHKTLDLAQWQPILATPGVRFVDLQYGDTAVERARVEADLGIKLTHLDDLDLREDVDGVAALAAACDLVISISTTLVHIAAGLGRPTWVLVPAAAGSLWYWMRGDEPSPWYSTATIFRQPKKGDWQPVITDVAERLKGFVAR